MSDFSDAQLDRLLKRRLPAHKDPEPSPDDGLELDLNSGLGDEEMTKKVEFLTYQTETLEAKTGEMEGENQRLRVLLRTRENDMFKLKNELDELKTATSGGGLGSEKAIQRIVELSKKNRDLISQLESEKNSIRKLKSQVANSNNQEVQRKLKSAVKAQKSPDIQADTERLLKEKTTSLSQKLTESQHQIVALKQEVKLHSKVLQRELGEGVTVQSILSNQASWRGRAEQIAMLTTKVNNLKCNDTSSEMSFNTSPSKLERQRQKEIKQLENNRKHQINELKSENDKLTEESVQNKKNYDAVRARNTTLGQELKTVRSQLGALIDKGKNDDQLIDALMNEKGQTPKEPSIDDVWKREEELESLRNLVKEKEQRISNLEKEITDFREKSIRGEVVDNFRPPTHPRSAPGITDVRASRPFDVQYLLRASEVEKERLFELTEMLNGRLSHLEGELAQAQTLSQRHNRQNVELEKQVQQLKCKKLPRCDMCNAPATIHTNVDSQLAILQDEVEVLKTHVTAAQEARSHDLVRYKELLKQSRSVFLEGLKQHSANLANG